MRAYGIEFLNEGGRIRIDGENPDFTVRPTWWFADRSEMPSSVTAMSSVLPVINKILRTVFWFIAKD